jgi:two-component system sensor histidine kinase RegB
MIESFLTQPQKNRGQLNHAPGPLEDESLRLALRGPVRLRTLTVLRWLAVGGQTAAIFAVHFGLGFHLPLGFCLAAIAASAWLNLFTMLRFSPQHFLNERESAAFISFDIVQLCVLLALTGGLNNPFALLILAPVTIAASVLPLRLTAVVGTLAIIGLVLIGVFHLPLPWRLDSELNFPAIYTVGVGVALIFAVGFFAAYAHRVAVEAAQVKSALTATQLVLSREERLAAIGGLAAAAAHELGTPLATIQVTAKEMARELAGQDLLEEDARLLVSQAERCRDILGRLSNSNVAGDKMIDEIALDLLLKEAAAPFADEADGPAVIFEMLGAAGPMPVVRRRPEILYGLRNIIENACGFAVSRVLVTADWNETEVKITVLDDGPGFSSDILGRLGAPYVSSRSRARSNRKSGMGLGFFIAKTLLERTRASVSFGNAQWQDASGDSGASVTASWPRSAIETI